LDVPVELEVEKLERKDPDKEKLQKIFDELEFKTMASSILGTQGNIKTEDKTTTETSEEQVVSHGTYQTIKTVKHDYQLVENESEIEKLILSLSKQKEFCFDTETTGLDYHSAELTGIAFSWEKNKAFYVYLPEDLEKSKNWF
jgi:DNA polymerase-1